jgi:Transposase, Mutator family
VVAHAAGRLPQYNSVFFGVYERSVHDGLWTHCPGVLSVVRGDLQTKADEVRLKMPKLRQQTFETAIIERYRRRESTVEEALIEMCRIRPTLTAGGLGHSFADDQAAISKREAFQFHGNSSAMRLAG